MRGTPRVEILQSPGPIVTLESMYGAAHRAYLFRLDSGDFAVTTRLADEAKSKHYTG
jgi:hypothetical protein